MHKVLLENKMEKYFMEKECAICYEQVPNVQYKPCNHVCICGKCIVKVVCYNSICPICRTPPTSIVLTFQQKDDPSLEVINLINISIGKLPVKDNGANLPIPMVANVHILDEHVAIQQTIVVVTSVVNFIFTVMILFVTAIKVMMDALHKWTIVLLQCIVLLIVMVIFVWSVGFAMNINMNNAGVNFVSKPNSIGLYMRMSINEDFSVPTLTYILKIENFTFEAGMYHDYAWMQLTRDDENIDIFSRLKKGELNAISSYTNRTNNK